MAEFVFKDIVNKSGKSDLYEIASAATSTEEIGNLVHPGTRRVLEKQGISAAGKRAVQMIKSDYNEYDFIVAMDQRNIININRIIGKDSNNKVRKLLDYTHESRDISDPWYTGDFEQTYRDVKEGCEALFRSICQQYGLG
jgi:protein-tyrosine phosphatase